MWGDLDRSLARLISGHAHDFSVHAPKAVSEHIAWHGIAPLLAAHAQCLPQEAADYVERETLGRTMWELRHRTVIADLLEALRVRGIEALVLKGSALAYSVYDPAAHRLRGDTDLLVRSSDFPAAAAILRQRDFSRIEDGAPDMGQSTFRLEGELGADHVIDLHRQTLNAPALASVLTFESIVERATPLTGLADAARAPDKAHMLQHLACHWALNRTGHYRVGAGAHRGRMRLIWLYDAVRLVPHFIDKEWAALREDCERNGLGPVCAAYLTAVAEIFAASAPGEVYAMLASSSGGPASRYMLEYDTLRRGFADLAAVRGFGAKLEYARRRLGTAVRERRAG